MRSLRIAVQVALSSLVIVPAIALFACQIRLNPKERPSAALLFASFVAQCVESEAALWLVLNPALTWVLRYRGSAQAADSSGDYLVPPKHSDFVLPATGPVLAGMMPLIAWSMGFRGQSGGYLVMAAILIFLIGLAIAVVRVNSAPRVAASTMALIALALPCALSLGPFYTAGRKSLERSLGRCHIARECLRVLSVRGAAGNYGWADVKSVSSAVLTRLKPARIDVRNDTTLKLEFGGGFEHYGYRIRQDEAHTRWILEWYTEGPVSDETLLIWPIGSDPCDHDPGSG